MGSGESPASGNERTAIVTGAARGIGKAIALSLAHKGISIGVADMDIGKGREAAAEIEQAGGDAHFLEVDVTDLLSIRRMVANAAARFGSVDILVNNAGILSTTAITEMREEEWDRTLDINLKGAVFATQAVLEHMIPRRWGRIVNISSMAGRMGGISTSCAYTASKSAMIGVTMNIARKVAGDGITVNAIAPGTAKTEMVLGFTDRERAQLEEASLVGRLVEPESIGETVAFLVSDAAAFITGAVIDVNGGMFMG